MLLEIVITVGGLVLTLVLGLIAGWVVDRVNLEIPAPMGIEHKSWKEAIDIPREKTGTIWLGWLERTLFFASLWVGANIVIAGWLAFKLGSKWAVWEHIMKVPANFPGQSLFEDLRIRNAWGTRLASKFLLGTLYNIVCALAGVALGKLTLQVIRSNSLPYTGLFFP